MNVICEGFHAGRKAFWIGQDVALCVAIDLPAVVDDEIDVAGIAHAARHHGIGHRLYQILADVAGKLIPTVPTHRRSFRQTIIVRLHVGPAHEEQDNSDQCFHSFTHFYAALSVSLRSLRLKIMVNAEGGRENSLWKVTALEWFFLVLH